MTLDEALRLIFDDLARKVRELGREGKPMLMSDPMNTLDHLETVYPKQFAEWSAIWGRGRTHADGS